VTAGATGGLSVTTTGAPAHFQWQFNGTNILGATNASLLLGDFHAGKAGRYAVIIQSASGWQTSAVVGVSLLPRLSLMPDVAGVVLNWDGDFTLQTVERLDGPFADVFTGAGPHTNSFVGGEPERYFRLRVPSPEVLGTMQSGEFALTLRGSPGRRYIVEASTNLVLWQPQMTNVFPFTLEDSTSATAPQKFYRARLMP
jgi:hypothetical protein